MSPRYAQKTEVPVSKTQFEIKELVQRYGAVSFQLGETTGRSAILFEMSKRRVRFDLPLPDPNDRAFTHSQRGLRAPDTAAKAYEQACRSRWRALFLSVKAKLEAVEVGITTFDEEFLAHIVTPDGSTVGQTAIPAIARAYETGDMPPLLPNYS